MQHGIVGAISPLVNGADHRNQISLQIVEDGANLGGFHARLEDVEQGIVQVVFVPQILRHPPAQFDGLFQVGREGGEVVLLRALAQMLWANEPCVVISPISVLGTLTNLS
jgi:hypothetical protein